MQPFLRVSLFGRFVLLGFLALTTAGTASRAAAQDDPAAYVGARLGAEYAHDARFDAALRERASASHAQVSQAAIAIERGPVQDRVESAFGKSLRDIGGNLAESGLPQEILAEAIEHQAWRRATLRAIIVAERPPVDEAALGRLFEARYGPGGVRRTYREVFFTLDPIMSKLLSPQDVASRLPEARAAAHKAADELASDIKAGKTRIASAPERGALIRALDVLQTSASGAIATAKVGEPFVVEGPEGVYVAIVDRRFDSANVEGVKMAILPRRGENADQLHDRLRAAVEMLHDADDPAMFALDNSDDEDDRRSGGVVRGSFGVAADGAAPARRTRSTDNASPAILAALASVSPGEVTQPIPWKKGFAFARLVKKDVVGEPRGEGTAACFLCNETAVRTRLLGGSLDSLAAAHAADVLDRVKRGEPLAQIAMAEGEHGDERRTGGILLDPGASVFGAQFASDAAALPVGEPPRILRSNLGYHVIQCIDQTTTRFSDVRAKLAEPDATSVQAGDIDRLYADLWSRTR
jgi:hypothetical protein